MKKKYTLFWQNIEIGKLTQTYWDMRSSGVIDFALKFQSPIPEYVHIKEYIKHSIKGCNLLEYSDEAAYRKLCEKDIEYFDLINGSDWIIRDSKGENIRILCPVFFDNNEIVWQKEY